MQVYEIIATWLREHGYDGLCTSECACRLGDNYELMPCCSEGCLDCESGYIHECATCSRKGDCDTHAEGANWCVTTEKGG